MSTEEKVEIRKIIVIDASPEVVFKAITDPKELTNWFPDQAILEPRVGGKMKLSFYKDSKDTHRPNDRDYFPEGIIIEFIPDKKISYTWEHPNIPDFPKTVVTWELQKIENNRTKLNLVHTGFKADKMLEEHDEGWTYFLNELGKYCKQRG